MSLRVFISYSRDSDAHRERVLALADRLRADGIESQLDQYIAHPPEGWPAWAQLQIAEADFTILVCTPLYTRLFEGKDVAGVGHGVTWEAGLLTQALYEAGSRNHTLIPVWFPDGDEQDIPRILRPFAGYPLPAEYDDLCRHLTDQPRSPAPPVGPPRVLSPMNREPAASRHGPPQHRRDERPHWPRIVTTAIGLVIAAGTAWAWVSRPMTTPGAHEARLPTHEDASSGSTDDHLPKPTPPPTPAPASTSAAEPHPTTTSTADTPPELAPTTSHQPTQGAPSSSPPPTKPRRRQPPFEADSRRWKARAVLEDPEHFAGKRLALDGPAVPPGTILTLAARCEAPTTNTAGPRCRVLDVPEGLSCQLTRSSTIPAGSSLCIHPRGTEADPR